MPHFFQRRDRLGNSPAIWVLSGLLFLAPLAWWSLQQIRLENDIETWLPPDDPNLKVLHWAHELFPVDERIFITWNGSSLADPRIDQLIARLEPQPDAQGVPRGGSPYVSGIVEPREVLQRLQENEVEPAEAVRRLEGVILGAGPLRVRWTEAGRASTYARHPEDLIAIAARELKLPLVALPRDEHLAANTLIPGYTSPTGEAYPASNSAVLNPQGELVADVGVEHDFALTWRAIGVGTPTTDRVAAWLKEQVDPSTKAPLVETTFFVPGAPVAIAVALSEAGQADKRAALEAIRAATLGIGIAEPDIKLGGSAVASSELNREVAHAVWNPDYPLSQLHQRSVILSSALVGAILAWVMLRDLRLTVLVLATALYTTYLTVSLVPVTGGSMNMVLVVMPTLLMVITLSGGIHVANYWRHAAANDPTTAVVEACRTAKMPCILAAITTAIGLASLCTSQLSPVREFGLYSALGTILSVGMVLIGLPSLLLIWPGKPPHDAELDHPVWRGLGKLMTIRPGWQTTGSLALCLVASYGLVHFRTETKVIRYFPDSSRIVQDYWFIEGHLAGIVPVETIVKFDASAQDDANFLDRMELVRELQEALRKHPEITGCISLADFQPVAELPDDSVFATTQYFKRANIAEDRIREGEISGTEAFYRYTDEARDLDRPGDGKLNGAGDELWRITAQVNVMTNADYADILADIHAASQDILRLQPGASHVVTGAVPLFLRTQQAVLDSLISSSILAFAVILVIFIVQLRSISAGLFAMVPNIVPITIVYGLISYYGIRVDIGTMITASIALGMAVDGTLHFLEWFKKELVAGKSRHDAVVEAVTHCGPAIWQTSWVIMLGLLVLVPAELLLISRFGWLMATMVVVAMWGDLVLLPQMLASPIGKVFEPRQRPPADETVLAREAEVLATNTPAATYDATAAAVRFSPQ
jgi:predicted RND superfamily exporter protein